MSDLLAALRRDLHEAELTAAECRAGDEFLTAVIAEEHVARLERRIATLEWADGMAYGSPMDGQVAA